MQHVWVEGWGILGCARDDKLEGTRESVWVILTEMHGDEIQNLKRPYPAARQDSPVDS